MAHSLEAQYYADRREFLKADVKGSFTVHNGLLMYRCPCEYRECRLVSVIPVSIHGRLTPRHFDWNGSTAIPTIEPGFTESRHWSGRLSGGIWITRSNQPWFIIDEAGKTQ